MNREPVRKHRTCPSLFLPLFPKLTFTIQKGDADGSPMPLDEPCEFDSCAKGDPAQGFNESDPRINYVNSFPVAAMRYGIETLARKFFNGSGSGGPDIAVAGVNVGCMTPSFPRLARPFFTPLRQKNLLTIK